MSSKNLTFALDKILSSYLVIHQIFLKDKSKQKPKAEKGINKSFQ
jgi:hypothetical protein